MKLLLLLACLAVAALAENDINLDPPYFRDYHAEVGIPEAARIKLAEESMDFDGARIVGGSTTALGAQPHMGGLVITLTNNWQSVCGSSLLTNTRLVTAAHCWRHSGNQARTFTVVLGSIRLFTGGTRINTSNVQMHAGYVERPLRNDIAMIIIGHVGFNNNMNGIALASGTNQFVGQWATAVGFGQTGTNVPIPQGQVLRQVNLQVITNAVCANTYGTATILNSVICVGTPYRQSTCSGDSGGPLAIGSGSGRQLIGVTSFGHNSGCDTGFPAGFARVTYFNAWIRARM